MDSKKTKVILIGSGVLAFGIVVYIVFKNYGKRKPQPQVVKRCPAGYTPANGKCKKVVTNGGFGDYSGYGGEFGDYTAYNEYVTGFGDYTGTSVYGGTSGIGMIVSTKNGSRLRKEPNVKSDIIKTYDSGVTLEVVGQSSQSDGIWYNVQEKSAINAADIKRQGWMRSDVVILIGQE